MRQGEELSAGLLSVEKRGESWRRLCSITLILALGMLSIATSVVAAKPASAEVGETAHSGGARLAVLPNGTGYWIAQSDGDVSSYGMSGSVAPPIYGSLPGLGINVNDIVGIAATPDGGGYWLVGSDGGVFSFGDAQFFGSMGGEHLNQPIVAMAASNNGGYWLVAADGGVFTFGAAQFSGSMGGTHLNAPIVDMSAAPNGGYWLVGSDGGVFAFGGAPFFGSMGGTPLVQPILGLTSVGDGLRGYWLVAGDGGVFAFGQAAYYGSLAGSHFNIVGLIYWINTGNEYFVVEANGAIPVSF